MSCARRSSMLLGLALLAGCADEVADPGTEEAASAGSEATSGSETSGDGDGDGDMVGDGDGDASGDGDGDPSEPPPDFFAPRPLNIAHRGGRFEFPEHTLVAYEGALSVGADVLELDVRLSADGQLMVIHDATVDRTTDGSGAVAELSVVELQALDAGYAFSPDGGQTHPYRGMGLTIPTLDEVFAAFPDELYVIEIKDQDTAVADALVPAIVAAELAPKTIVSSSQEGVIEHVRGLDSSIYTGMTVAEVFAFVMVTPETEADYEPPTPFVQVPLEYGPLMVLDPYRVALAESKGMKVHPFTINDADTMQTLLDWGVHGIITDWPSTLTELIDGQGP